MNNGFKKQYFRRKRVQGIRNLMERDKRQLFSYLDILNNSLKSVTIFSVVVGSIYIIYYIVDQVQYFPLPSLNDITSLAFVYFFIAFVLVSLPFLLIIFPSEMVYQVKPIEYFKKFKNILKELGTINRKNYREVLKKSWKIIEAAILLILSIVFLVVFLGYAIAIVTIYLIIFDFIDTVTEWTYIIIGFAIIFLWFVYYSLQGARIYFFISLVVAFMIFLTDPLSKKIAKRLKLGNYVATLVISDEKVCNQLYQTKEEICTLKGNILWRSSQEYIIEVEKDIYKIPTRVVIMEKYSMEKKHKRN